jgi:hypothetical protein
MAILTYYILGFGLFAYERTMLAVILLFSGGTFLYVATAHVLPEIQEGTEVGPRSRAGSHGKEGEDVEAGRVDGDEQRKGIRGRVISPEDAENKDMSGAEAAALPAAVAAGRSGMTWLDVACIVGGIISPLFITLDHFH